MLAAPVLIVFAALATVATGQAAGSGTLTMGPQSMEGNLVVAPGAVLEAGYDLTIPGSHPAVSVTFSDAQFAFAARCTSGGAPVSLTVAMPDATYAVPAGSSQWFPSGDQHSSLVYQGSIVVPDVCGGGTISLQAGGTF